MAKNAKRKASTDSALLELRAFGLAYPGAHTKSPWPGHLDLAVNDKTFVYLSIEGEPFKISCKLPHSAAAALMLGNVTPTPYGLGKSGWVSGSFPSDVPVAMLEEWIDESYRAQAPKKLVKTLDEGTAPSATAKKKTAAAPKKTVAKKKTKAAAAPKNTARKAKRG